MLENIDITHINTLLDAPLEEPKRQYYYIAKAREYVEELNKKSNRPLSAAVITFGCQMNFRDSEKLTGILTSAGFLLTDNEEADLVIYNTCTIRDNANRRVYGRLGKLKYLKKKNPQMKIALCGCMMQEETVIEKIKSTYNFVDLIFGTHNIYKFAELLVTMLYNDQMTIDIWKETDQIIEDLPVKRKYPFKSGINIMFGCNNHCSYCIVPYVRGRERSRPPEEIINEIMKLVADGVTEIMLLGQNVNSYGLTDSVNMDRNNLSSNMKQLNSDTENQLTKPVNFPQLLRRIDKIEGLKRIRFMTSHPKDLSDELITVMKESEKICRHLHLPLQSGSTRILEAMNRCYTKEDYLKLVAKIRKAIPDIALTTDIIVGFPGETEDDFAETIDVVKQAKFDNAFTFIYSKRSGTPAAIMPNQVAPDEAKQNFNRLLKVVQETSRTQTARLVGEVHPVLVEEVNEQDNSLLNGRLSQNTLVHFPGTPELIGEIVNIKIIESHGFYYLGEMRNLRSH